MKKNISINISGIIFHIEEDGYDTLKKYLDSINRYFSSFEDSAEILADIESRIAEIFLSKLNEGKQVITADDVQALIATMGSVRDFKAAEEEIGDGPPAEETAGDGRSSSAQAGASRPLMRDRKREILGGVCAGLANHLKIDPVWIRLLFTLFTVAYGITIIVYVVLWIVMPPSYDMEEPESKKMFRDPENKVLGGVSQGVAAYFGAEVVLIRLLFIALTFAGGVGLLLYVVLWIVLPEARTLTDRMKMQGEPVTLSNIESNIKKGFNVKEEDESVLVKILLFPFRAVAYIVRGLGKIVGPLFEVVRVATGILVILAGFSLVFAILVAISIVTGFFTFSWPWLLQPDQIAFPVESLRELVPVWLTVAGFFTAFIPALLVILLGAAVIGKRSVISAPVGWSLFALFFISLMAVAFGSSQIAYSFKEHGEYRTERVFRIVGKTSVFKLNEIGMDDYDAVSLTLRGYDGKDLKLVERFEAHGSTRQNAIEHAQTVDYTVVEQDSTLVFDSNLRFRPGTAFRAQELDLTLYIPYNRRFVMDESFSRFISHYVDYRDQDGYTWHMTPNGPECMNCPAREEEKEEAWDPGPEALRHEDFNALDIKGIFNVSITPSDKYAVTFSGPASERDKYNIYRSGETLVVNYSGRTAFRLDTKAHHEDGVQINIAMPALRHLKATGMGSIQLGNVAATDEMRIDLNGPINLKGEINTGTVVVDLTGNAEASLQGRASALRADINFASELKAYDLTTTTAIIEVNGASSANVNASEVLEMEEGIASNIHYQGTPRIIRHD